MAATASGGVICDSAALREGGAGVRFMVEHAGTRVPAFVVRYRGVAHAYLNRCSHRGVELDWDSGRFFSALGGTLICATHGAQYAPDTGACLAGPCRGGGLVKLAVIEKNNHVLLVPGDTRLCSADDTTTGAGSDR